MIIFDTMTYKKHQLLTTTILLFVGILLFSCTKTTPFGAELLDDQLAELSSGELPVICTVEQDDNLVTADRNGAYSYFLCGELRDPDFGYSRSEIFTHITHVSNTNLVGTRFDSAFLILPYDVVGIYGDTTINQMLRVQMLTDSISNSKDYRAGDTLIAGEDIATMTFLPRPRTLEKILDTASTAVKAAHLKVPITQAFGERLLAVDSVSMTNKFLFWDKIKGLKISSTAASAPGAMLAFDLNSTNCFLRLYYTKDTTHYYINYNMGGSGNKFMHFTHDYTGTPAAAAMAATNPDLLYVKGMQGLRLKVEFPTAPDLENILINKAELEFTALNATTALPEAAQIATFDHPTDSTYVVTDDVAYSLNASSGGFEYFGGIPEAENGTNKYRLTLTKRFQDIVDSKSNDPKDRTVYIFVYPRQLYAGRAVLGGVNHPQYPLKMKVKYTKL